MSEFSIRSESVDVEQIMKQIRQRILEKRGADYTEDQIRELASVRLEKFLDPKNLRSDLLEQFRKSRPALEPPRIDPPKIEAPYAFDDQTLFASHRGPMRLARKLLRPLLKLFFNPNTLNQILHTQAQFNVDVLKRDARRKIESRQLDQSRAEWNMLYYEVLHNIVLETTRMGIEVQNLRMKVESLGSRLDFSERRVRALEGVVQYRPEAVLPPDGADGDDDQPVPMPTNHASVDGFVPTSGPAGGPGQGQGQGQGDGSRRKRRRRRGRRGGGAGESGAAGEGRPPGAVGATGDLPDSTAANAESMSGEVEGRDEDDFTDADDPGDDNGLDAVSETPVERPGSASDVTDDPDGGPSDDNGQQ